VVGEYQERASSSDVGTSYEKPKSVTRGQVATLGPSSWGRAIRKGEDRASPRKEKKKHFFGGKRRNPPRRMDNEEKFLLLWGCPSHRKPSSFGKIREKGGKTTNQ